MHFWQLTINKKKRKTINIFYLHKTPTLKSGGFAILSTSFH